MSESTVIRVADLDNPRDAEAILALTEAYAQDLMGGGKGLSEHARQQLIPALRQHPSTFTLLACQQDDVVGAALCFLGFSSFAGAPTVNVHDLSVLPDWRGKGIGRRLLEAVAEAGRACGASKLILEVRPDNRRARALYRAAGFKTARLGGQPYLMMEKALK